MLGPRETNGGSRTRRARTSRRGPVVTGRPTLGHEPGRGIGRPGIGGHRLRSVIVVLGLAGFVLTAQPALGCRLDHFRIARLSAGEVSRPYGLTVGAERTAFTLGEIHGDYTRWSARLELELGARTLATADMSLVALHRSDRPQTISGAGNPVVGLSHSRDLWNGGQLSLGLQTELPAGTRGQGLAGDHLEVMPHLGLSHLGRNAAIHVDTGIRVSLGGGDDLPPPTLDHLGHATAPTARPAGSALHSRHPARAEEVPLLVDPHAEREWVYRLGVSVYRRDRTLSAAAFLDGTHILEHSHREDIISLAHKELVSGVEVGYEWSGIYIAPSIAVPLHQNGRFDTRLRLRTETRF